MSNEQEVRDFAVLMHNIYEREANKKGWNTQNGCQVEFANLPEANKNVMLKVSEEVMNIHNRKVVSFVKAIKCEVLLILVKDRNVKPGFNVSQVMGKIEKVAEDIFGRELLKSAKEGRISNLGRKEK